MLNSNTKKWLKALRSGKYIQTQGQLGSADEGEKYCVLGVACEIAIQNGVKVKRKNLGYAITYNNNEGTLPPVVKKWLGLKTTDGAFVNKCNKPATLMELNDDEGMNFKQIADVIVRNQESLFKE